MIFLYFILAVEASALLAAGFIALVGSAVAARYRLFWSIFGNNQDQVAPDWFRPGEAIWIRNFLWYFPRNQLHNLFWHVIGINGKPYTAIGRFTKHVFALEGQWNWAILSYKWMKFPFVSYRGTTVEWYLGWRPNSGSFGLALRKSGAH